MYFVWTENKENIENMEILFSQNNEEAELGKYINLQCINFSTYEAILYNFHILERIRLIFVNNFLLS